MSFLAELPDRRVIHLAGADRVGFLQGLVSNDVTAAAPGRAVWTALLTPQGKYLAEFFILASGEELLLDCDAGEAPLIMQRLSRFRLRSAVTLAAGEERVYVGWGGTTEAMLGAPAGPEGSAGPRAEIVAAADPRLPDAGIRVLSRAALPTNATALDWDRHRLALGLPDGARDLEPEKSVLLEAGFDELQGVSWTKGCYMGQELTARTRYRGLVKRRLVPVSGTAALPPPGTPVYRGEEEVGSLRSTCDRQGLALLRLAALDAEGLRAGEVALSVRRPDWMRL